MSRNTERHSADELRAMAVGSTDPVIRRALEDLARDLEEERGEPACAAENHGAVFLTVRGV